MEAKVQLNCEPCPICKKVVPIFLRKEDFKPSITGVSTVVDVHGLDMEERHIRILYVDKRMSVRSFSIVKAIADTQE